MIKNAYNIIIIGQFLCIFYIHLIGVAFDFMYHKLALLTLIYDVTNTSYTET